MSRTWTLRGNGLQLWPTVTRGPGFDDEEEIVVVEVKGASRCTSCGQCYVPLEEEPDVD